MSEKGKSGTSPEELDQLHRSKIKVPKHLGDFSGSSSSCAREEDWMHASPEECNPPTPKTSYANAAKKNTEHEEFGVIKEVEAELKKAEQVKEKGDEVNGKKENNEPDIIVEVDKKGRYNLVASAAERSRLHKPWENTLLITLMGKKIGFTILKKKIDSMWARNGFVHLIDIGNEYFLVRFNDLADYNFALSGGPWLIFDHYLAIRSWEPNFNPYGATINKLAAWIRLPGLAMEYYDKKWLQAIGNLVGKTLKVDVNTALHYRGKFARLCVELDMEKTLMSQYSLHDIVHNVEYEGVHLICFLCGRYGHDKAHCPNAKAAHPPSPNVVSSPGESSPNDSGKSLSPETTMENESDFGPWMVVQRPRRPVRTTKGVQPESSNAKVAQEPIPDSQVANATSRFEILSDKKENSGGNQGEGNQTKSVPHSTEGPHKERKREFVKGSILRKEKAARAIFWEEWTESVGPQDHTNKEETKAHVTHQNKIEKEKNIETKDASSIIDGKGNKSKQKGPIGESTVHTMTPPLTHVGPSKILVGQENPKPPDPHEPNSESMQVDNAPLVANDEAMACDHEISGPELSGMVLDVPMQSV